MSNIDKQALREIAEQTKIAGEAPVMPFEQRINALNDFMKHFTPATVLALLDELEVKDSRVGELEAIATDYGMKFQRAQDALKHQALLHKSQMEAAPPATVVPEEMTMADAIMEIDAKDADRWTGRIGFQKGWNACRAAMLNQEKSNG